MGRNCFLVLAFLLVIFQATHVACANMDAQKKFLNDASMEINDLGNIVRDNSFNGNFKNFILNNIGKAEMKLVTLHNLLYPSEEQMLVETSRSDSYRNSLIKEIKSLFKSIKNDIVNFAESESVRNSVKNSKSMIK